MDHIEQLAGCKNGSCPKIFRQGDRLAVQGDITSTSPEVPGETTTVRIPRDILLEAAPALGAGRWRAGGCTDDQVVFAGRDVLVKGTMLTSLTRQITPGPGETVVEIPRQRLEEAIGRVTRV